MKYFIENKQGEWLMNPDEVMGPGNSPWTRDPLRAWGFDKEDLIYMKPLPVTRSYDEAGKLSTQMFMMDLGGSPSVTWWLEEEECLAPGTLITEHEFIEEYPGEEGDSKSYRDLKDNSSWVSLKGDLFKMWSSAEEAQMKTQMDKDFKRDLLGF